MAQISHVERISQVIDSMANHGMTGLFMGVPVEEFDKERLIKLLSIQNHAQEKVKKDYEFLGYLDGLRRGRYGADRGEIPS